MFHSRPGKLRASELTQIPQRPQAQPSWDDTKSVTFQSLLNCGHKCAPLQRQGKPCCLAVSQVAISSWWSLPGSTAHPQGDLPGSDTQSSQPGWSQQAKVFIMQLIVQLQPQVLLHNQADKHLFFFSGVASYPKWCSQKSERRQVISRKPSGKRSTVVWGQEQVMQRLWAWCTLQTQNTSDDCHSRALYTSIQYILQWHQGSYKVKFLLENHLCMDSSIERAREHLQTSCSNGKGSNLCWVQLFGKQKKLLHKPGSTWNYSFIVSTNSDHFLLRWNTIFSVFLLLKRWGLSSERGRRPETSFEKLLIQYLSPWNLRESREICRRKFLILSNLTIW